MKQRKHFIFDVTTGSREHPDLTHISVMEHANNPEPAIGRLPFLKGRKPHLWYAFLRTFRPVWITSDLVVVTRYQDVEEILRRHDDFDVPYVRRVSVVTNNGQFFLGMRNSPRYESDIAQMRLAMRRDDLEHRIRPLLLNAARQAVVESAGEVDLVADLARLLPARLMIEYLGLSGLEERQLSDWAHSLFHYLFVPGISADKERQAIQDATLFRAYLDGLIEQRLKTRQLDDDVIGRLLSLHLSGQPNLSVESIRNNLMGIIVGAITPTAKSIALALDFLLDHPEALALAQGAALDEDLPRLNSVIREALRHNPFAPGIYRVARHDVTIRTGAWRSTKIKAGQRVLAVTQSAMWDRRVVKRPGKFEPSRPAHVYLDYGLGLHACFGQYINDIQMAAIVLPLLQQPGLRRAPGELLQSDEAFPLHMRLEFNT
ncbi:cytochrome P450 [Salinispirillum sp. LH 10-3-1]|uniref:Cytochrome P450 n=1 Tax=Salinispirillum sp. LH 10-3-1 TaxID=2952525 RepID=A0AB38YFE9_9GAMM